MPNRKWNWNFGFFSGRTPTVAYWTGFLMADGGLSKAGVNSWCLALVLQKKDEDHLISFCEDIGLSKEAIYTQVSKPHMFGDREIISGEGCGVHITHPDLYEQLKPWGIVPRKTYEYCEPQISDDLLPHYLRGWADGDGQVYSDGTGARFTVSGNPDALRWYETSLRKLGYSGGISFQHRSAVTDILYIGGANQVKQVIGLLVKDGDFKLERKWGINYETKQDLIDVVCAQCGKHFGVRKFRYEHPTQGRFCSEKCYNESQKKPVIDGKSQCARCKNWFEEMSGNKSYCKQCWRDYNTEKRRERGQKPQTLREKTVINGVPHTKCPKCNLFKPDDEIKSTYCRSCQTQYTREHRERNKK